MFLDFQSLIKFDKNNTVKSILDFRAMSTKVTYSLI